VGVRAGLVLLPGWIHSRALGGSDRRNTDPGHSRKENLTPPIRGFTGLLAAAKVQVSLAGKDEVEDPTGTGRPRLLGALVTLFIRVARVDSITRTINMTTLCWADYSDPAKATNASGSSRVVLTRDPEGRSVWRIFVNGHELPNDFTTEAAAIAYSGRLFPIGLSTSPKF
jgi:hypothetical protein